MKNYLLSDEEIQAAVADHEEQTMMVREKISALNREIAKLSEAVYEYLSWYDRGEAGTGQGKDAVQDPVNRIVEKKEREYRRFRREFANALAEQEAHLARLQEIRLAYLTLPPDEYLVMRTLYEEAVPWKAAAGKLGISRRTLAENRKRAIAHIRDSVSRMEQAPDELMAAETGVLYGKQE